MSKCEILVSYVIELSGPLSIMVETFNDEKVSFDIISNYIKDISKKTSLLMLAILLRN